MKEKLYPFSARKHIHDLSFRSDRAANDIARLEAENANPKIIRHMQELKERLDTIICIVEATSTCTEVLEKMNLLRATIRLR